MKRFDLACAATVFLCLSCGQHRTGGAKFIARFANAAHAADVTQLIVRISGGGLQQDQLYYLSQNGVGGAWTVNVQGLPVGTGYQFRARAFDANGTLLFEGSASADIQAGVTSTVLIVLQDVGSSTPVGDVAPQILSLVAGANPVQEFEIIPLFATVSDPDDTPAQLTYSWTAKFVSNGADAGIFTNPPVHTATHLAVTWEAPLVTGPVSITFRVTDHFGAFAQQSFIIDVIADQHGEADISVTLNNRPVINSITATSYRLQAQSGVTAQNTSTLTALATDDDGNSVTYAWSSDCAQAVLDSTTHADGSVLVVHLTGGTASSCRFNVLASDAQGGAGQGYLTLPVAPDAPVYYAPVIDTFYQSSPSEYRNSSVQLQVQAHDQNTPALPLTYNWQPTVGTGTTTTNTFASTFNWQPGLCSATGASATVTIDNGITTTTKSFQLQTCAPPSCWYIHQLDADHSQGDGLYDINPQGAGHAPISAWCDMTRFGGGYQLVTSIGSTAVNKDLLNDDFDVGPPVDPAYPTGPQTMMGYGFYRFAAYGDNYTVLTAVQVTDGNNHTHEQFGFFRPHPTLGQCGPECAGANWCGNPAATGSFQYLYGTPTTGLANTNWLSVAGSWASGFACGVYTGVNFGFLDNTVTEGVPCLDIAGQTARCYHGPGVVLSPSPGGITSDGSLGDGVPFGQTGPELIWIRAFNEAVDNGG